MEDAPVILIILSLLAGTVGGTLSHKLYCSFFKLNVILGIGTELVPFYSPMIDFIRALSLAIVENLSLSQNETILFLQSFYAALSTFLYHCRFWCEVKDILQYIFICCVYFAGFCVYLKLFLLEAFVLVAILFCLKLLSNNVRLIWSRLADLSLLGFSH